MDIAQIRRDLHDMETHRTAWSSILRQASDHAIVPDAYLAAAEEIEAASASFTASLSLAEPESVSCALAAVDRLLEIAPRLLMAIDALSGSAASRADGNGFREWLTHERTALNMLALERSMMGLARSA